jgi:uncharacterized protein with HEPN domain
LNNVEKKYLFDILASIEAIGTHLSGTVDYASFSRQLTMKRAIEREFEIIGEAVRHLVEMNANIQITDSRKIIALRNRIIHGYDTVDDAIIWAAVIKNLPVLKDEITKLLES